MTTLAYILTSSRAIQDAPTGKFSHIDLFDAVNIPKGSKDTFINFCAGVKINNVKAGNSQTSVKLYHPNGTELGVSEVRGELAAGDVEAALYFNLIKIDTPGKYYLHTFHDGVKLADGNRYYITANREL